MNDFILVLVALVAFTVLTGCQLRPPEDVEPPPPPPPVQDGGVVTLATCATACANQRAHGCELGRPTAEGSTCEEVCDNTENAGLDSLRWDLRCLTDRATCAPCPR